MLLTSGARKWLEQFIEAFPDEEPETLLEYMASGFTEDREPFTTEQSTRLINAIETGPITPEGLNAVYSRLQENNGGANEDEDDDDEALPDSHFKVINAFQMPRLNFDGEKRNFELFVRLSLCLR